MRRWMQQALGCVAIAAGLWSGVIFMPAEWVAAPAASIAPAVLTSIKVPESAHNEAGAKAFGPNLRRQFKCLALNIYWEAKSEPVAGKVAVAAVTLNRLVHPAFPDTICGVVMQGADASTRHCQFSWACDRRSDRPRNAEAWEEAKKIAYQVLFFGIPDPTGGALYFHATYVHPRWARSMVRAGRIGRHIFYREPMSVENEDRRPPS